MRRWLLVLLFCGLISIPELWVNPFLPQPQPAYAAGNIDIPKHGPLGETASLDCEEKVGFPITLELRHYDFDLVDPYHWQAVGIGKVGEPDYFVVFWLPEHEVTDVEKSLGYVDRDRDGKAEETLPWLEATKRSQNNWCNTYVWAVLQKSL